MKAVKIFAALAAVIAGIVLLIHSDGFSWNPIQTIFGVILLAAGATYFWQISRFYRN